MKIIHPFYFDTLNYVYTLTALNKTPMTVKKLLITFLMLQISSVLHAQIPYATEQPAWYMTLYAEDASGTRDSVFIGYDPEATNSALGKEDERFGEIYIIPENPNEFRMSAEYWSQPTDSAKKVSIRNNDFNSSLNFTIHLDSAIWPVAFTWDVSLLRSDSLPFVPADTNLPNAQIWLGYGGFNELIYADNADCYYYSVLITDTVSPNISCFSKDMLVLGDFFMNPYRKSNAISIDIMPWNGRSLVDIQEINKNTFSLSPNPVVDELTITLNKALDKTTPIFIHNSMGQLVKKLTCNQALSQTFDLTDLDAGLYIAKLQNKQGVSIQFIKH
ncbi:MAG: hypothetical protein ACJAUV_001733 [Flavobacteriales bacterium]|jgi:hypothetical protein